MDMSDFAVVSNWEGRLDALAALAEPERWDYLYLPPRKKHPILSSYVNKVFLRAKDNDFIYEDENIACFNTGLLTRNHQPIIGVFTVYERYDPNSSYSAYNKKRYLKGWFAQNERILAGVSDYDLELVRFWDDPADLIFDPRLEVRPDLDHIVDGRLSRFPIWLGGKVDSNGVPTDLASDDDIDDDFEDIAGDNQPIPARMLIHLEGAISRTVRLAKRSYRMAVPQYHGGKVKLLLPLYFGDQKDRPDLALTLERHKGCYTAATVLLPDWAYRHARLLARPNSEWLGGFRSDVLHAG